MPKRPQFLQGGSHSARESGRSWSIVRDIFGGGGGVEGCLGGEWVCGG